MLLNTRSYRQSRFFNRNFRIPSIRLGLLSSITMFFPTLKEFSCLWPKKIRARRDLKNHLPVNKDNFRDGKDLRGRLVQPLHFLDEEIEVKPVMCWSHPVLATRCKLDPTVAWKWDNIHSRNWQILKSGLFTPKSQFINTGCNIVRKSVASETSLPGLQSCLRHHLCFSSRLTQCLKVLSTWPGTYYVFDKC